MFSKDIIFYILLYSENFTKQQNTTTRRFIADTSNSNKHIEILCVNWTGNDRVVKKRRDEIRKKQRILEQDGSKRSRYMT